MRRNEGLVDDPNRLRDVERPTESRVEALLQERLTRTLVRGRRHRDQLDAREVVDALGNEARDEVAKITAALQRMESGNFGLCVECGARIEDARLQAHPYAEECIECARLEERRGALL